MAALNRRARLRFAVKLTVPIEFALAGFVVSALLFPVQTVPQIIGICIGWAVGFWVLPLVLIRFPEAE